MFFNSSLVKAEVSRGDIELVGIPAGRIAEELGSPRSANMVMLGAFVKKSNLVSMVTLVEGLKSTLKSKTNLIAINKKALMAGYDIF